MIEDIPELDNRGRDRDCGSYSVETIDVIVCVYIFEGMSTRDMDNKILEVDPNKNHGWKSFAILHHFGLGIAFKGYFIGKTPESVIELMCGKDDYNEIVDCIRRHNDGYPRYADSELETVVEVHDKEGKRLLRYGTVYERSKRNRDAVIRIHGTKCMVYGFDFEKTYGEIGRNFIEVHHIKPLFTSEEMIIDPETDMVCLCSNCHRMIHRIKGKILTCDELKEMIY